MTILWALTLLAVAIVREFAYFMWRRKAKRLLKERRDFIERLARTELVQTSCADEYCPCCEAANTPIDDNNYVHLHGCIVVEARRLLGLPTDERGNLVEGR